MSKEKQTPITITSSSLVTLTSHTSPKSVYGIHSKSTEDSPKSSSESLRRPVTWHSRKKHKLDILGLQTPSVVDRVTEWMGRGITENDRITVRQKGSSMIVRCDFDKIVKEDVVTESNVREVTSLYSYLEKNMKAKSCGKTSAQSNRSPPDRRFQTPTPTYQQYEMQYLNSGIQTANYNPNGDFTDSAKEPPRAVSICDSASCHEEETASTASNVEPAENYEVPLSPESQKKELCMYLQLMNPADKKQTLLLQNRRSVRVKNLNLLMEKKQLEQKLKKQKKLNSKKHKLNVIDLTETDDSLDGVPTLKSFKDLNIHVPDVELCKPERKQTKVMGEENRVQWSSSPLLALRSIDFDTANEIHSQIAPETETNKPQPKQALKKKASFRWPSPPLQALRRMDFDVSISGFVRDIEETRKGGPNLKMNGHVSRSIMHEMKQADSNDSELEKDKKASKMTDRRSKSDIKETIESEHVKDIKKHTSKDDSVNRRSHQYRKPVNRKLLRKHSPRKLKSLRSQSRLRNRPLNSLITETKFRRTNKNKLQKRSLGKLRRSLKPKSGVQTVNTESFDHVKPQPRNQRGKFIKQTSSHQVISRSSDGEFLKIVHEGDVKSNETPKVRKDVHSVKTSANAGQLPPDEIKRSQENKDLHTAGQVAKQPVRPSCEIVQFRSNPDDENFDLGSFIDDINELDGLSEEHRRCLIESRILAKSPHTLKSMHHDISDKKSAVHGKSSSIASDGQDARNTAADGFDHTHRDSTHSPAASRVKTPIEAADGDEVRDVKNTIPLPLVNGHAKNSDSDNSVEFINWKVVYTKKSLDKRSPPKTNRAISNANVNLPRKDFSQVVQLSDTESSVDSLVDIENRQEEVCKSENTELNHKSPIKNVSKSNSSSIFVVPKPNCFQHFIEESNSSTSSSSSSCEYTSSSSCSKSTSVKSNIPTADHDYIVSNNVSRCSSIQPPGYQPVDVNGIEAKGYPVIPLQKPLDIKSLHKSLTNIKRKSMTNGIEGHSSEFSWSSTEDCGPSAVETQKAKYKNSLSHSIRISNEDGPILKAFYVDDNLIICQESQVGFWTQSALGQVLGAQNMWLPKGKVQRLVLTDNSVQKDSAEMIISIESTMAYVELWTKEHKSDIREGPVADVFATIYFWKQGHLGLDKKVLQLENINGFGDDVQYVVLKSAQKIIVSWHCVTETSKGSFIHCYDLAADYQTVHNINEMEPVKHYVSSLHNIEDCDSLLMGCGENKITLWNLDYGYVVATIELNDIKSPLLTLWVKCVRGFLFTLQQCVDGELRLIAINGMNHSWKRLQSYNPPEGFDRLKGVSIENGILVSFYEQGILCWNAQNGEPVVEEIPNETEYIPSGRFVIININGQIVVRHALTHLVITDDS